MLSFYLLLLFCIIIIWNLQQKEDFICGKGRLNKYDLWKNCIKRYGNEKCTVFLPQTFLNTDKDKFSNDTHGKYILKKTWVGMRQGLLLSDSKSDTLRNYNSYDLVQRFITNPYLINGYKLNLRYFLVVDCYPRQNIHIYRKGICYYTPEPFNKNGTKNATKIAEGASVLGTTFFNKHGLPKTTSDFYNNYLTKYQTAELEKKLVKYIKLIVNGIDLCCDNCKDYHLFGIDVELLDNLQPIVLEINSAPSVHYKGWLGDVMLELFKSLKNREYNSFFISI